MLAFYFAFRQCFPTEIDNDDIFRSSCSTSSAMYITRKMIEHQTVGLIVCVSVCVRLAALNADMK